MRVELRCVSLYIYVSACVCDKSIRRWGIRIHTKVHTYTSPTQRDGEGDHLQAQDEVVPRLGLPVVAQETDEEALPVGGKDDLCVVVYWGGG